MSAIKQYQSQPGFGFLFQHSNNMQELQPVAHLTHGCHGVLFQWKAPHVLLRHTISFWLIRHILQSNGMRISSTNAIRIQIYTDPTLLNHVANTRINHPPNHQK